MTGYCVQCLCPELRWPRLTAQSEVTLAVSWLWLPSVSLPLTTSVLSHPPSCRILLVVSLLLTCQYIISLTDYWGFECRDFYQTQKKCFKEKHDLIKWSIIGWSCSNLTVREWDNRVVNISVSGRFLHFYISTLYSTVPDIVPVGEGGGLHFTNVLSKGITSSHISDVISQPMLRHTFHFQRKT